MVGSFVGSGAGEAVGAGIGDAVGAGIACTVSEADAAADAGALEEADAQADDSSGVVGKADGSGGRALKLYIYALYISSPKTRGLIIRLLQQLTPTTQRRRDLHGVPQFKLALV